MFGWFERVRGLLLIISMTVLYMSKIVFRWKVSATSFIVSLRILWILSDLFPFEL